MSFYCYMYLQVHCSSAEHAREYFDSSIEYESCIISYHYSHLVGERIPPNVGVIGSNTKQRKGSWSPQGLQWVERSKRSPSVPCKALGTE